MNPQSTIAALALIFGMLLSLPASYGAAGIVKGTVEFVRVHDAAVVPAMTPPRFWFSLNGVTSGSAGACGTFVGGRVMFISESKEALATILSAYMTGKEVSVYFDDAITVLGPYCRAGHITVGNPPPLF